MLGKICMKFDVNQWNNVKDCHANKVVFYTWFLKPFVEESNINLSEISLYKIFCAHFIVIQLKNVHTHEVSILYQLQNSLDMSSTQTFWKSYQAVWTSLH